MCGHKFNFFTANAYLYKQKTSPAHVKKLLRSLFIGSFLMISCYRDKEVLCTSEYRMLSITVKDSAGHPVIFTSHYVRKTVTGEILQFPEIDEWTDSVNRVQGIYVIMTDSKLDMTTKSGNQYEFHGKMGNPEVLQENYIIGNDGCHVTLIQGNTNVMQGK